MKNYIISSLLLVIPMLCFADVVEIDGIYYNLIPKGKVAEVTKKSSGKYTGDIVIPESVTYENIEYSVTTIGNASFYLCKTLTSISIPNSVTSIEKSAFYNCTGLTSVTIPNSVTSIGDAAFDGCSGLTSVDISNSVTTIGHNVFYGCNSLTSVTIPNSVTSIGVMAFAYCRGLMSVSIPNSVTSIGNGAFIGCSSLISVAIPNSVDVVGEQAFKNCTSLNSVVIGDGVKTILYESFYGCTSLSSLTIGKNVTTIGRYAFSYCSSLNSVTIPNSVTTIGDCVFQNCSSLVNVSIPNSVTTLGDGVFSYCSSLTSVMIPQSVTSMGYYVFMNCSSLTSVNIPYSVSIIRDSTFKNCISLSSITIPNTIKEIEYGAFNGCSGLTSLIIPNSVTSIGTNISLSGPFKGCISLIAVTIPNSISFIGTEAFEGCVGLTSLTIGKGVKSVSSKAFANCSELTDVYCYADKVPSTNKNAFDGSYIEYATLHVPANSVEAYKSAAPWSNFGTIVAIEVPKHTLAYTVDGTTYKTYTIEEGATISAEAEPTKEGYAFSGWSEIPSIMPDHDVTVTGTFTINKYKLAYMVDGTDYKLYDVEYNSAITPETAPVKEGYTFSGWSEIPSTMPANDVTITGTFTVNKYKLTYLVDGEEYKASEVDYGTAITAEAIPSKEGYTFSGWSEIPSTMPSNDVTISGTFTINKYTITYIIDGEVFKSMEVEYNSAITLPDVPAQEGYDFSWTDVPETMPASDIAIYGTYITGINGLNMEESDRQVFTPDGKCVETPKKGLNIIRVSDGTVKKVVVK